MQEMQRGHFALACQTLHQMKEEDDPFIYGQAHHYLALSALYTQATQAAIAYHEEAVKVVERNGLHILKDPGHMISDLAHLEASEVLERAVFLSTLLHMEIVLDMFDTKKRTLCYTIEEEFRYRFPVCLSDSFPGDTWMLIRPFSNTESVPVSLPGFPADFTSQECASCEGSFGNDRFSRKARYTSTRCSEVLNSHSSHDQQESKWES